jgi:hypothetical protein
MIDQITLDGRTGFIVSGHGRANTLKNRRAAGENPPDGVLLTEDGKDWLVPTVVGWSSRTDTEATAALIALNRTTELGGWVDDELLTLLDELSDVEDGLAGIGFYDEDRHNLRKRLEQISREVPAPESFKSYGDDISVDYQCPSCGYEWSGQAKAGR